MFTHDFFTVATNLFGLNFYESRVGIKFVLFVNFLIFSFTIYYIYAGAMFANPDVIPVFVFVDFCQLVLPLLLKVVQNFHAFRRRNSDKQLEHRIKNSFPNFITDKNEKLYLVGVAVSTLLFTCKIWFSPDTYNLAHMFTTVMNQCGDFFFAYQVLRLRDYLRELRKVKGDTVKSNILNAFEIQKTILDEYSSILCCSICVYFVCIILSLYWIFLRVINNAISRLQGE